ncbi:uncharacterized protein BCR38DRAFT_501409 [Pseudomassariella vexata]|uniref:Uncharacterized protein n=1 Tax=Pseudomassariella vexata TaxID=1141098 RepID=A0A1Y2DEY3_9PEZI|nr:uncharacterized protein BCR38DRAFT_501409 [Pseudomassariella vexata]ORY57809.1 hypothetical protein BCR38DRAFT_501409 [Pseudomassariella vexata]
MYNQGKIMRRLLGRSNESNDTNLGVTSSPISQSYRPNASQDAIHHTGVPISCIDRSSDGQYAVIGGRHILKTVKFDGLNIKEKDGIDIRAIITAQQINQPNSASSTSDQLSIKDVKWATNESGKSTIFTACANGKIFQYDVSRLGSASAGGNGLEFIQMREDSRQVNKLDINPHKNTLLLSGSQDGIVRVFDIRAPVPNQTGRSTFRNIQAYRCNAEGVRDVKWSPKEGVIFACATESGAILKWDIRTPKAPLLRINAHDAQKGASSISWHPDGDHLISGGLDSKCHVWDMSKNADKKQKPKWTISTPAPVTVVSWRPGLWSATAQGKRAAQVAVSYEDGSTRKQYGINSVHIWDLARPTMPFKEIDRFDSSPNALLWHDQDLLWTGGSDGLFTQCDVAFAPKVIDRQSSSSLDFSPRGDVLMFLEERPPPPRPRPTIVAPELAPTSSHSSNSTTQMLSISRSDSEDDVVGSFLGPRRRAGRRRRPSTRASHTFSTTPPSGHGMEESVLSLEQAISVTGTFKPQQVMAIGHVPAAAKANVYHFLSVQYLETLEKELPLGAGAKPLNERIAGIMEHYARSAEIVSQYRLAQTWRILSYAMNLLLARRAQYHLELRTNRRKNPKSPVWKNQGNSANLLGMERFGQSQRGEQGTPRKPASIISVESRLTPARSLLAEEFDTESNLPTPLARPVEDAGKSLAPVQEIASFALPPAVHQERPCLRPRLDSAPLSVMSQDSQISSTDGYDFYDLLAVDALPMAIEVPKKKEPFSLAYVGPRTPSKAVMARHDSDESFVQMFSLSDGTRFVSNGSQPTTDTTGSFASQSQAIRHNSVRVSTSGTSEDEFGSRVRGYQIQETPQGRRQHMPQVPEGEDTESLEEIFMISQTTADTGDSEYSQENSQEPSHDYSPKHVTHARPLLEVTRAPSSRKTSNERIALGHPEEETSPEITETDFMPWPDDPPYPHPLSSEMDAKVSTPPSKPYNLLLRAIEFETKRSSLNASAMILLLKPLLPDDMIDTLQAAAVLRQYHNRLMGQKFFIEAALLRNLCVRDWPEGIDIWGENYTSVFTQAQERVSVGFTCPQCKNPREVDRSKADGLGVWQCERCRYIMAPCAICKHRDATPASLPSVPVADGIARASSQSEPILSSWWYCPGCSHGGHATCLQGWHAPIAPSRSNSGSSVGGSPTVHDGQFPDTYSDGCCPLDGCGHACLPGKWRDETNTARTEELGRAVREQTRVSISSFKANERVISNLDGSTASGSAPLIIGGVKSDALEVPQSGAVEWVREALANPKGTGSGTEGGKIEKTERERRKSVKFAGATEERR